MAANLSKADIKAVATEVVKHLAPSNAPVVQQGSNVTHVDTDPVGVELDKAEAKLIAQLPNSRIVIYRGKRSSFKVNETQEALNALMDYRRERKSFKTGQRV